MAQFIRDVMTPNPASVTEKESVKRAAEIMKREDAGVVPVLDGRKIVGIVTDRDIVVRVIAEGKDCSNAKVGDAMSKQVRTVKDDTPVDDVLELMSREQIRRVPVCNSSDELVGIVSIGDIASESKDTVGVGRAVENISEAPPNN
ncbi:MAG TPA: CBS domain-containing protein [Thermoanaerobaculia bacterium]|nr:CBS domain-containing protein [Thermoanaerobaculia bacterium]